MSRKSSNPDDCLDISDLKYRYGVGPRIAQINEQPYRYRGFGRLDGVLPVTAIKTEATHASSTAATGLNGYETSNRQAAQPATLDALGRTVQDSHYRYTYTSAGQVETVSDATGKLLASYAYNSLGQRVRKLPRTRFPQTATPLNNRDGLQWLWARLEVWARNPVTGFCEQVLP